MLIRELKDQRELSANELDIQREQFKKFLDDQSASISAVQTDL